MIQKFGGLWTQSGKLDYFYIRLINSLEYKYSKNNAILKDEEQMLSEQMLLEQMLLEQMLLEQMLLEQMLLEQM